MSATAREQEARLERDEPAAVEDPAAGSRAALATVLAWVFPGLGHLLLGRKARAALFAVTILCTVAIGYSMHGNLYTPVQGHPLTYLAALGSMGMGLPYFLLLYPMHYEGDVTAPGFDYGTAFLLAAGLMNLLLVLDAWDIGNGRKD